MEHIVGILPAGGRAKRIHGFFKEMMPIGINENDNAKFVVTSERILWSMLDAGASSVHFLLNSQKSFIAEYYAKQEISTGRINFNYITTNIENLGMPYALDNLYPQTRDYAYVMLGLPDTVIEPPTSFKFVLDLLRSRNGDLALGLFETDNRNRGGYVTFDPASKTVTNHVDKVSPGFPDHADNAWAIVCWNARFTEFMHSYLDHRRHSRQPIAKSGPEMIFGDLIDGALAVANGVYGPRAEH